MRMGSSLPSSLETAISLGKGFAIRLLVESPWQQNDGSLESLKSMAEHGAVNLVKYLIQDFDRIIRLYGQYILVIGLMVDCAEGEAIAHGRNSLGMLIL